MTAPPSFHAWMLEHAFPRYSHKIAVSVDEVFTEAVKASGYIEAHRDAAHSHLEQFDRAEKLQKRIQLLEEALKQAGQPPKQGWGQR